jgi:hypothetical protein
LLNIQQVQCVALCFEQVREAVDSGPANAGQPRAAALPMQTYADRGLRSGRTPQKVLPHICWTCSTVHAMTRQDVGCEKTERMPACMQVSKPQQQQQQQQPQQNVQQQEQGQGPGQPAPVDADAAGLPAWLMQEAPDLERQRSVLSDNSSNCSDGFTQAVQAAEPQRAQHAQRAQQQQQASMAEAEPDAVEESPQQPLVQRKKSARREPKKPAAPVQQKMPAAAAPKTKPALPMQQEQPAAENAARVGSPAQAARKRSSSRLKQMAGPAQDDYAADELAAAETAPDEGAAPEPQERPAPQRKAQMATAASMQQNKQAPVTQAAGKQERAPKGGVQAATAVEAARKQQLAPKRKAQAAGGAEARPEEQAAVAEAAWKQQPVPQREKQAAAGTEPAQEKQIRAAKALTHARPTRAAAPAPQQHLPPTAVEKQAPGKRRKIHKQSVVPATEEPCAAGRRPAVVQAFAITVKAATAPEQQADLADFVQEEEDIEVDVEAEEDEEPMQQAQLLPLPAAMHAAMQQLQLPLPAAALAQPMQEDAEETDVEEEAAESNGEAGGDADAGGGNQDEELLLSPVPDLAALTGAAKTGGGSPALLQPALAPLQGLRRALCPPCCPPSLPLVYNPCMDYQRHIKMRGSGVHVSKMTRMYTPI